MASPKEFDTDMQSDLFPLKSFWLNLFPYLKTLYFLTSSVEEAIIKISFRNIIRNTFNFHNRGMGLFINFVISLGAGPNPKHSQKNWYRLSFNLNFRSSWDSWCRRTEECPSLRSTLHMQFPFCKSSFRRNNPSFLKCSCRMC